MGQADDALMVLESDPNSEKVDESAALSEMDLLSLQQEEVAEDNITRTQVTLNTTPASKCG